MSTYASAMDAIIQEFRTHGSIRAGITEFEIGTFYNESLRWFERNFPLHDSNSDRYMAECLTFLYLFGTSSFAQFTSIVVPVPPTGYARNILQLATERVTTLERAQLTIDPTWQTSIDDGQITELTRSLDRLVVLIMRL